MKQLFLYWLAQTLALIFATFFYAAFFHTNIYWPYSPVSRLAGGGVDWFFVFTFSAASLAGLIIYTGFPVGVAKGVLGALFAIAIGIQNLLIFFLAMLVLIGEGT